MKIVLIGAAVFAAIGGQVSAQTATPDVGSDEGDKIICERAGTTGTRLGGKKICKAESAWIKERAEIRRALEETRNNRGQRQPGQPGG